MNPSGSLLHCTKDTFYQSVVRVKKVILVLEAHRHEGFPKEGCSGVKVWNRERPEAVECVIAARTRRLQYEREIRVGLRKQAITATALIALRTPVPNLQHAYYPPPHTIHTFPPFVALLNQDSDEFLSLTDPKFSEAFADAPTLIEAWENEMQTHLVTLLPGAHTGEKLNFRLLERATSVFTVCKTNARSSDLAIGWAEPRAHLHWFQGRPQPAIPNGPLVMFNPHGSAVAAELATLLGMDPKTATVTDMDKTNERFVCGNCPLGPQDLRPVMRWRDCVLHVGSNVGSNPPASHGVNLLKKVSTRSKIIPYPA
ncbi:hypothetical protein C8R45DRAFT_1180335 [Mycena sanguinolenta]|nr:hypothetical protein C8R45DRAFT_1180335 [Mycena sanguinolenta]